MADLIALLTTYAREHDAPITIAYHPDADPGDGSGWSVEVGDMHTYGQLLDALRQAGVSVG